MNPIFQDLLVAVGLLGLMLTALETGFRAGRRRKREPDSRMGGQIGAVQGALLGLLGLLLAFSFSAAGSRFLERQDLIVAEANAIGTAYLRADVLDEPHRTNLRNALQTYTERRIEAASRIREGLTDADFAAVNLQHSAIWNAAVAGAKLQPQTLEVVLPPVNDVIDLHTTRMAAGKKHVPPLVMGLLIACSALAVAVIGFGNGLGGHRHAAMTVPLTLLIGISLWITVDLDHPRAGLMQLSDAPLRALKFE